MRFSEVPIHNFQNKYEHRVSSGASQVVVYISGYFYAYKYVLEFSCFK